MPVILQQFPHNLVFHLGETVRMTTQWLFRICRTSWNCRVHLNHCSRQRWPMRDSSKGMLAEGPTDLWPPSSFHTHSFSQGESCDTAESVTWSQCTAQLTLSKSEPTQEWWKWRWAPTAVSWVTCTAPSHCPFISMFLAALWQIRKIPMRVELSCATLAIYTCPHNLSIWPLRF